MRNIPGTWFPGQGIASVGLFRPFRRQFWFWWNNRRRWKALDALLDDPVLRKGIVVSAGSEGVFIEVPDGRRFFWNPRAKGSLLGIPSTGTFEPQETELLRSILRPSDVAFDIGANFGWYTTLFSRRVGPEGSVHAFEPVPPTFHELQNNVRLNGSSGNVSLNSVALGERDGTVKLHVPTRIWLGAAFASAIPHHEGPQEIHESVMETLDSYIERKGIVRVDLIKCDVEGAELQVLRGGRKLLSSSSPPMWFLEVYEPYSVPFGYRPADLFAFLRGHGYECYRLEEGNLLPFSQSEKPSGYNFLCILPEHHRDRVEKFIA